MKIKYIGQLIEISSDNYIHKKGTNTYVKKCILTKDDTVDNYEEVDEIPSYTIEEYESKVEELVHLKYSLDKENAILRKNIARLLTSKVLLVEKDIDEFNEYNDYVEYCKIKAKELLNNK